METPTNTPKTPQTVSQAILLDTRAIRRDLNTILRLAETVTVPMEGETDSFMEAVLRLLGMIVAGVEENRKSLEALHQRFDQPGIAMALQRMTDAD